MRAILRHLWQLPQHLVAWILIATGKYTLSCTYKGRKVFTKPTTGKYADGVSLGGYIFLEEAIADEPHIAHEYGHSRQSMRLGWLYFIVIGIPSAMNPLQGVIRYRVWPEGWANKLGGVRAVQTGPLACNYKLEMI